MTVPTAPILDFTFIYPNLIGRPLARIPFGAHAKQNFKPTRVPLTYSDLDTTCASRKTHQLRS